MGALLDGPALVLVALTLSAALLLVEVALPTFGVAGLSGLALAALAVATADRLGEPWWPLLAVAAAVCVWAVLLTFGRRSPSAQLAAAGLFGLGSGGYGVLAGDPATIVLAVVGTVGLPIGFRPLLRSATRLLDMPPQLGMDALVGRTGTVTRWQDGTGTVRVDGSLWNACGPPALWPGVEVSVLGYRGMTLDVALYAPVGWGV
ncbi:MAG: NfeD family protein [Acidimicrobiia bacterium]